MKATGSLDFDAFEKLLHWHCEEGTDGIVVLGTTGEAATLSVNERAEVIKFAIKAVNHRVPVIVGTGTNNTRQSIDYSLQAERFGTDGCLLVTPYYNKPTQQGLIAHFKAIASELAVPVLLYNGPDRTACDILPETVAALAPVHNIIGIKEATGDLKRLTALQAVCPEDFIFLSGDDSTACDFILAGGHGTISVTANIVPARMHAMCEAALAGRTKQAKAIDHDLRELHQNLFVQSNPIPAKWALLEMGMIESGIRLPLLMLEASYHGKVRQTLKQMGLVA